MYKLWYHCATRSGNELEWATEFSWVWSPPFWVRLLRLLIQRTLAKKLKTHASERRRTNVQSVVQCCNKSFEDSCPKIRLCLGLWLIFKNWRIFIKAIHNSVYIPSMQNISPFSLKIWFMHLFSFVTYW